MKLHELYGVSPRERVVLADRDPKDRRFFDEGKKEGIERMKKRRREIQELQRVLAAQRKHRVLIVLQGMDTSGKDGTIRHVLGRVNPQGVRVTSFKQPVGEELHHDYLWRVHPHVPGDGELAVFNRSHYEDVLVPRVAELVSEERWRRRYRHIRAFERMLVDEGTTIIKLFLHIDHAEQKRRLEARLEMPHKRWKFRAADLEARDRWDDYLAAYEELLSETSTEHAPWIVVPANSKWYRNLVIASLLADTLSGLGLCWPEPEDDLTGVEVE